jgi:acetolactate synthase-1/2/3 large subunit
VIVEAEANVYPMIPAGGSYRDIIMTDDDLARISREKQGSNV